MKVVKSKKKIVTGILVVGLLLFTFGSVSSSIDAYAKERYTSLQLYTKVLNLVQQYYVEKVDTKKLIYGGIKGMLQELDPHTNFLPPELYKEFESETSGEFGGLGVEITVKSGVLTVISPIEDTPAWRAGLKSGDKVVSINGESTKGLSLAEAAQKMKGKKGSKVVLGIYRDGFEAPKDFAVVRGTVKIKSVKYTNLGDGFAYVRLTSFIERSFKDMKKVIAKHKKKNKALKGMVLDLRRNPGGLLDQAVQISDLFLEKGVIVSTIGRDKKGKEVLHAKKAGTLEDFPIIVMIDEYSASASEILAGALRDNKRALIMGKRSFGKGSVQSLVKLGDGSGLKLTVARYYTPSGVSIQAEGIVPDVEVDDIDVKALSKATPKRRIKRERDMKGHLLGDKEKKNKSKPQQSMAFWWNGSDEPKKNLTAKQKLLSGDFQVLQAYNYLKAWGVMKRFDKEVKSIRTPAKSVN